MVKNYKLLSFSLYILLSSISLANSKLTTITPETYISQNPTIERKEIVNFIVTQFDKQKQQGVTQQELDNIWNNIDLRHNSSMIRFQIIDQKLYVEDTGVEREYYALINYFHKLVQKYNFKDVDFIIYNRDEIIPGELSDKLLGTPAFMLSKDLNSKYEKDLFLLPDTYMMDPYWQELIARIKKANSQYEWSNKINEIFWKGSLTGGSDDIDSPDMSIRLKLVILSKLYPNIINARLKAYHKFIKDKKGNYKTSIASFIFGPNTPLKPNENTLYEDKHLLEEDHLKYKYLISIDGNTAAWSRPAWIMYSNSVLIKQETKKIDWFYPAMKPYIHYVPVNEQITNIFEQFEWMKNNDSKLIEISQNAQNFVKNCLMPEDIEIQTVLIINEYSKLFNDKKLIPTLPTIEKKLKDIELFQEAKREKNLPRKKKIIRFFKNIKEKIANLWS